MMLEIKPTAEGIEPEVSRPGLFISEPTRRLRNENLLAQLTSNRANQPLGKGVLPPPDPPPQLRNENLLPQPTSNRANQPLGKGVLPRTSRCRDHLLHPQRLDPTPKLVAVAGVTVTDQIPWGLPLGEGLHHLLPYPFRGRMFRDSKMKYFPPLVLQNDEHE